MWSSPGDTLPLPSNSIDLVVADWVVEHLEDPGQFADEMRVHVPLVATMPLEPPCFRRCDFLALVEAQFMSAWRGRAMDDCEGLC